MTPFLPLSGMSGAGSFVGEFNLILQHQLADGDMDMEQMFEKFGEEGGRKAQVMMIRMMIRVVTAGTSSSPPLYAGIAENDPSVVQGLCGCQYGGERGLAWLRPKL